MATDLAAEDINCRADGQHASVLLPLHGLLDQRHETRRRHHRNLLGQRCDVLRRDVDRGEEARHNINKDTKVDVRRLK